MSKDPYVLILLLFTDESKAKRQKQLQENVDHTRLCRPLEDEPSELLMYELNFFL